MLFKVQVVACGMDEDECFVQMGANTGPVSMRN